MRTCSLRNYKVPCRAPGRQEIVKSTLNLARPNSQFLISFWVKTRVKGPYTSQNASNYKLKRASSGPPFLVFLVLLAGGAVGVQSPFGPKKLGAELAFEGAHHVLLLFREGETTLARHGQHKKSERRCLKPNPTCKGQKAALRTRITGKNEETVLRHVHRNLKFLFYRV